MVNGFACFVLKCHLSIRAGVVKSLRDIHITCSANKITLSNKKLISSPSLTNNSGNTSCLMKFYICHQERLDQNRSISNGNLSGDHSLTHLQSTQGFKLMNFTLDVYFSRYYLCHNRWHNFLQTKLQMAVADPDFPDGGGHQPPRCGTNLLFGQIFPKIAWKWKKLDTGGGGTSLALP